MKLRDVVPAPRSRRRSVIELGKDLLILLLVCSAACLSARSQLYHISGDSWLGQIVERVRGEALPTAAPAGQGTWDGTVHPVRLAVCLPGETVLRYGVQYDEEQLDRDYAALEGFLSEALASARDPEKISERAWRKALSTPGVYFDLLGTVPMQALCRWSTEGGAAAQLPGSARRLILVERAGAETAVLCYRNEEDGSYYACATSVLIEGYLEQALWDYTDNGARFAFELSSEDYAGLAPETMILPDAPTPERYQAAGGLDLTDDAVRGELERLLGFRGTDYAVPGEWVLRDGDTLRLSEDGTLAYDSAGQEGAARYPVEGDDAASALDVVWALLNDAETAWSGGTNAASLCLWSAEMPADGAWSFTFSYVLDGAPVLVDGKPAAVFQIEDGHIASYELCLRSYTAVGETTLVLPERQAAAALRGLETEGQRELALCYEDSGGTVDAVWTAR